MYLLGSRLGWAGRRALWELVEQGVLRVAPEGRDWSTVAQLMAKYRGFWIEFSAARLPVERQALGPAMD